MAAEAQVYDAPPGEGDVGDQLRGDKDVIADIGHLPGDGIPRAQVVQGLVQTLDAGGNADLVFHGENLLYW